MKINEVMQLPNIAPITDVYELAAILDELEPRLAAAKRGLLLAGKLRDEKSRKEHTVRISKNLARIQNTIGRVQRKINNDY